MSGSAPQAYQIITTRAGVSGGDTIELYQQGGQFLWYYTVTENTAHPIPLDPGNGTCSVWGSNLDLADTGGLEATLQGFVWGTSKVGDSGILLNKLGQLFRYQVVYALATSTLPRIRKTQGFVRPIHGVPV